MSLIKLIGFGDNDSTKDADNVLAAIMKEENVSQYLFLGDGPYASSGTKWTSMMGKYFDDTKKKLLMITRGNHDEDESESKQTQKDIEAWYPELKSLGISDTWLSSKQVGNVFIINMDTQDLDIEFKRDQYNWVIAELDKAKKLRDEGKIDWVIVLFHKPFFTLKSSHSPYTAVRKIYWQPFQLAGVDFCMSGHNHNTQLWLPMIVDESQEANGLGKQFFSLAADGKTFDFAKQHGPFYIVNGISGHEFNAINDSGEGVKNVMFFRDDAFGYTSLEIDGKKAKVLSKKVDGTVDYEYNVTREGTTTTPPPEPTEPCTEPNMCIDPFTKQCRQLKETEFKDANTKYCVTKDLPTDPPTEPPTNEVICPVGWSYNAEKGHCLPDLNPPEGPQCPKGYTWNPTKKICEWDGGPTQPPPCLQGECKDPVTNQCRPILPTEIKDSGGFCRPKPIVVCPDGQCKDVNTGLCRAIAADEEKDVNGFCKKKTTQPPPPPGEVLWDSNVHLKNGQEFTITGSHGNTGPDGKGVVMAASGNPQLNVHADGSFELEADAGHGRVYIMAKNYNAMMQGEVMVDADFNVVRNSTWRLRSRHQEGGACENRGGGFGATFELQEQAAEYETESCHNLHENSIKKPLAKKVEKGQWIKFRYQCCNKPDNKGVDFKTDYDYNDGNGWVNVAKGEHPNPPAHLMDVELNKKNSYAWLRINNEGHGKVNYRNVQIIAITGIDGSTTTPPPPPPPPPPPTHDCPQGQHWDDAQQKCVDDTVTPPPPPPPPQGNGNSTVDEFGTKIPFKLTGNKVEMEVGGDPAGNGQRYNVDHKFQNYIMIGYFMIGNGQEQIEMKTDGPHHGGCKKIPVCTWSEAGIMCADGQGVMSSEYPHPTNHPKVTKPNFKKIGKMEGGKWIGYAVYAYQSGQFRTIGQLGTTNPFGADGKPNNSWILATHMTDKGELTNEDGKNKDGPTRAVPPADGQVLESEIRMHGESKGHGKPGGTDMKWCMVYEIENPNTESEPTL